MTRLEDRLATLAAAGQTITYGALARQLDVRMGVLTTALEGLMEVDARMGSPFRAVLCEAKLSNGNPAKGFFDKALALGFDVSDPSAFVAKQRAALFASALPSTSGE